MTDKKYVVPEGMRQAGRNAGEWGTRLMTGYEHKQLEASLEAALRWLSENPTTPTGRQIQEMSDSLTAQDEGHGTEDYCREWQRRMFLASEPEVPEEIMDLMVGVEELTNIPLGARVIEAYRRGKASK